MFQAHMIRGIKFGTENCVILRVFLTSLMFNVPTIIVKLFSNVLTAVLVQI